MARIFITGSTEGLGLMAARLLVAEGHGVTLHARNAQRAQDARESLAAAETVVVGDLSSIAGMRDVAKQVNALGRFEELVSLLVEDIEEGSDGSGSIFIRRSK